MSRGSGSVQRYVSVDAMRFVAAMGIVVHHFATKLDSPLLQDLFLRNYSFVDLFFAISGFVVFHNYGDSLHSAGDVGVYLRNRLARIYPLHLLTFVLIGLVGMTIWRGRADIDLIVPSAVLPNMLLVHAWDTTALPTFNAQSWSISAEWFLYLVFPVVAWIGRRQGALVLFLLALIAANLLQIASNLGWIRPWTILTYDFGMLRALPTFLVGAALAKLARDDALPKLGFAPGLCLFTAGSAGMALGLDDRLVIVLLLGALALCVSAEHSGRRGWLTHPFVSRLGDLTYGVYLTHGITAVFFISFLGHRVLHLQGGALTAWIAAVAVGPTLGLAYVAYRWFEVPARRWLKAPARRGHGEYFVTNVG